MIEDDAQLGRQRLAWVILLGSFFVCLVISIAVPVSANAYIRNATRDLVTIVQANEGTVGIDDENGVRRAVIAGENEVAVDAGSSILTDATATALLFVNSADAESLLARLVIDGNSTVRIERATAPRFAWSSSQNTASYEMESGRMRVTLLEPDDGHEEENLIVNLTTPQGEIVIADPGQYTVEVNNQAAQVNVLEGTAEVTAQDAMLLLNSGERAEIPTGAQPSGPLDPERNLIQNSDFSESFNHWVEYTWRVELPDQPKGKTHVTRQDGEPVMRFERGGLGHADAQIVQSLNKNVSDFESLKLQLTLRIIEQSLGVCGVQGSECPLFVRVNYIDESGISQTWQQGFYAAGQVDDNTTPGACVSCALFQNNHERAPLGQEYYYEVDLRDELARQGALAPRQIESISLIASGHSFITDIVDVALIGN